MQTKSSQQQTTLATKKISTQSVLSNFFYRHILIISLCLLSATVTAEILLPAWSSNAGTTQIVGKAESMKQLNASRQLSTARNASIIAPRMMFSHNRENLVIASSNLFEFARLGVLPAFLHSREFTWTDLLNYSARSNALATMPATFASITVTTTADTLDAAATCLSVTLASLPGPDGQTSLREAICAANNNAGADTITFSVNGTFALTGAANEDNGGAGDFDIKQSLAIQGNGSTNTIIDGSGIERIFDVFPSAASTFDLSNLTIQNGDTRSTSFKEGGAMYLHNNVTTTINSCQIINNFSGANGAIENRGTLTINNSLISNNQTIPASGSVAGGGLHNAGALTIDGTTISNNTVRGEGGGIYTTTGVAVTVNITKSTISGNTASVTGGGNGNGGGISTTGNQGTLNLTNCTISGNRADNNGGGAYFVTPGGGTGNVTLNSVTVTNNTADNDNNGTGAGGGFAQLVSAVTLRNTIVAGNFNSVASMRDDISGAVVASSSYNLIGDGTGSSGITNGVNNNRVGSGVSPIDALLGALANNGGSTLTHALLTGSPAINAANNATSPATDQRGIARPASGTSDIGAYEFSDTTPPDTTITANPTNPSLSTNASFSFTGSDPGGSGVVGFQCRIDGGAYTTCTSPQTYIGLPDGSHTFQVRAIDGAGNVDPTPVSYTWSIDTVAPNTSITANPTNPSASTTAGFSFTGNDGGGSGVASFQCQLDGGGFSPCTSPQTYLGLSQGSHTFQVRAVDGAGNVDPTPASYTWVIDTIVPDTTITANPTNPSLSTNASFSFTGSDPGGSGVVGFQCRIDGGAYTTCTSPQTYIGLPDGSHTFQVRAVDAAGNIDPTSASFTWSIDTIAPDTTITANPTNPSSSTTANFSFTGDDGGGSGVASFQCQLDGGGFSPCTSPQTYLGLSQGSHTFQVRAVDGVGNVDPTPASFTWVINSAPVITQNPTDQTVNAGQTATFTAAATGSPTPTVQWQFSNNGGATFQNVAGATTTTLTVPNVSAGQNGQQFRAVFTNSIGSATTTAATMTVNFAPTVTTNPSSQSAAAGANVTFTAAANGNPSPTVQWQQSTDGGATFTNIAGATATTLSFTSLASQNGNQYRAVFTNSVGSATTTAATLTVTAGPMVAQNPTDQTVNAGQTATFTAAATGSPTPTVQWQFSNNGGATFQNVAGATTTTLTVPNVAAGQNGTRFRAVFTNSTGSATTTAATMTVNFAPTVTTNPISQTVTTGTNVSFTAAANGNPTPTVQWQQSTDGGATFTNIAGATATTLSFTSLASQNGNQYRAVFTNSVGSATTTAATLTVNSAPVITGNPLSTTVCEGTNVGFAASATSTPTPTVQWQVSTDGGVTFTNVPGATSTTLNLGAATAAMNGNVYHAIFTNSIGSSTTSNATLTVNTAPTVTNPASTTVLAGTTASFTVTLGGQPTPTVQWQVSTDGGITFTNIAGATATTLSFTAAVSDNNKQYRAVVTNTCSSATSAAATLTVQQQFPLTIAASIGGTVMPVSGNSYLQGTVVPIIATPNPGYAFVNWTGDVVAAPTSASTTITMDAPKSIKANFGLIPPMSASIGDPFVCNGIGGSLQVTATLTNLIDADVPSSFSVDLPAFLSVVPGSCTASIGACSPAPPNQIRWSGTIPAGLTVTFNYQVQIADGTPLGTVITITSKGKVGDVNNAVDTTDTVTCPAANLNNPPVNVKLSDQKAGSVLVFPYYTSNTATKADTRLSVTNVGTEQAFVHLFFLDGATCQQADFTTCLTPNGTLTFKASEMDPETTGWVLAVVVDAQGNPIQANRLVGNAFLKDGLYVGNYGAEAFWAHSTQVATLNGNTATLRFDDTGYDAVPNQFAIEVQSPRDVVGQKVITVGMNGDLNEAQLTGAGQVGAGLVYNANENPFGSFVGFLTGNCQARGTITPTNPRLPFTMGGIVPSGQAGTMKLNIGSGVGLLLTPANATKWSGIRGLHKTSTTFTTITIPLVMPQC